MTAMTYDNMRAREGDGNVWSGFIDRASDIFSEVGGLFGIGGGSGKKTRAFNSAQAVLQRDWASGEATKARDFEEEMSSTAMQRRVHDLQAAGLNPMLAYENSASSPSASAPSGASAHAEDTGAAKSMARIAAVNSAIGMRRTKAEIDSIKASTGKTEAETSLTEDIRKKMIAETQASTATAQTAGWQQRKLDAEYNEILSRIEKITDEMHGVQIDNEHRARLNPLLERAHALSNEAEELGMAAKRVEHDISASAYGKLRPLIKDVGDIAGIGARISAAKSAAEIAERLKRRKGPRE